MQQRLIEVLQRLPIAVRIVEQADLEGATWYCWQSGDRNGRSLDFVEAVEQALTSVFTFIAENAGYSPADFKHTSHTTLY
jgi:hypothetical protein